MFETEENRIVLNKKIARIFTRRELLNAIPNDFRGEKPLSRLELRGMIYLRCGKMCNSMYQIGKIEAISGFFSVHFFL